jgi:ankyrin repeat protein
MLSPIEIIRITEFLPVSIFFLPVKIDLKYGFNPKTVFHPTREGYNAAGFNLNYDAKDEAVLHIVMRQHASYPQYDPYLQCAELYLNNGADPNAIYSYTPYNTSGEKGEQELRTPLMEAIKGHSVKGLEMLLRYHVNVSQVVNNETPLMFAVRCGFAEGVKQLLLHDANPNQQYKGQVNTPLKLAREAKNAEIVDLLLASHAESEKVTPLQKLNVFGESARSDIKGDSKKSAEEKPDYIPTKNERPQ